MIDYKVRSRPLGELVADIRRKRMIISPYFQRNYVWRTIHKVEFIDTILKGYPFPQIFVAKGDIDVDTMAVTSFIVDGQQRLKAILDFIADDFSVGDDKYSTLKTQAKENFLKYEIPVIELDVKHDDKVIIDIFQRLNRTFYSLTSIERLATEYGTSEFMLVAQMLCGSLHRVRPQPEMNIPNNDDDIDNEIQPEIVNSLAPPSFFEWSDQLQFNDARNLILQGGIFSGYEISRQVPLMFVLNILGTLIKGFYARNEEVTNLLEEFKENYPQKDEHVRNLNQSCRFILDMRLSPGSYWLNKANSFSLIYVLINNIGKLNSSNPLEIRDVLEQAEKMLPQTYRDAAKEAVNNKRERRTRHDFLEKLLFSA